MDEIEARKAMPETMFTEVRSASWPHLREQLRELPEVWAFRGQAQSSWELRTTLEREIELPRKRVFAEARILHRFDSFVHRLVKPGAEPRDTFEKLALLQHHGTATRLLDFTHSPYVAAFFAVAENHGSDSAIWAIDLQRARRLAVSGLDNGTEDGFTRVAEWQQTMPRFKGVVPCELDRLSERQEAQQGVFVANGSVTESFRDNLTTMCAGRTRPIVKKFAVDRAWRLEILRDLRLMNVTYASLFPGLDGYARALNHEMQTLPYRPFQEALLGALLDPEPEQGNG